MVLFSAESFKTKLINFKNGLLHGIDDHGWKSGTAKGAHGQIYRCYDNFSYNGDTLKKNFEFGMLMNEFYEFNNYSTIGIWADTAFKKLGEQIIHFDSSLHSHTNFGYIVRGLKDAHISYKVGCYEQFTFVQPLYIQYSFENIAKVNILELQEGVNVTILYISGDLHKINSYADLLGICRIG